MVTLLPPRAVQEAGELAGGERGGGDQHLSVGEEETHDTLPPQGEQGEFLLKATVCKIQSALISFYIGVGVMSQREPMSHWLHCIRLSTYLHPCKHGESPT